MHQRKHDYGQTHILGKEIDVKVAREIAEYELGRPWMMSPAAMRMLFDWNERD